MHFTCAFCAVGTHLLIYCIPYIWLIMILYFGFLKSHAFKRIENSGVYKKGGKRMKKVQLIGLVLLIAMFASIAVSCTGNAANTKSGPAIDGRYSDGRRNALFGHSDT